MSKFILVLLFAFAFAFSATATAQQSCPDGYWNDCDGPQAGPGPCVPGCVVVSCPTGQYYEDCDGPQAGPGPCVVGCRPVGGFVPPPAVGVEQLCFPAGCRNVVFTWVNRFLVAESTLPCGYPVMAFAGPCLTPPCPVLKEVAMDGLKWNAKQANRARYHGRSGQ